jgi:hypothetical protein
MIGAPSGRRPRQPLRPVAQHVGNLDLEIWKRLEGDPVASVVHRDVGEAQGRRTSPSRSIP